MTQLQKYDLGAEIYVFRAQKGGLVAARGLVMAAEIDRSGYILYTVQVTMADGQKDSWRANNASIALSEDKLKSKMDAYMKFNDEQKAKYVELFGAPEFPENIGL